MQRLLSLFLIGTLLFGCEADGLIWMPPSNRADALFRIVIHDRAGFIDHNGRIIIPPSLEVSGNWDQAFYDGLLTIRLDGPFLNTKGQKILDNGFYRIWDFSEGLAATLEKSDSKWGYIDHSGQFVIPPQFPRYPQGVVSTFSGGLAAIEVLGKLGYIDHSGAFVIPRQFVAGTAFEDGLARVVAEGPCDYRDYEHYDPCMRRESIIAPSTGVDYNRARSAGRPCKWRFIDKTGKRIINAEFEAALGFYEGLAAVQIGDLWGFINLQGTFVIPPSFRSVHSFSDGLALVESGRASGFIDRTGKMKIPAEYYKAEPFSDGLAVIGHPDDGYYLHRYARKTGHPQTFRACQPFLPRSCPREG